MNDFKFAPVEELIHEISRGRMPEHTLEEFHENYGCFIRKKLEQADQIQHNIDLCQEKLAAKQVQMGCGQRLYPYFVLSDGQKLLNRYAMLIYGVKAADPTLAEELEEWFRYYKDLWRTTSRESELYRLGEVIFWIADTLRAGKV